MWYHHVRAESHRGRQVIRWLESILISQINGLVMKVLYVFPPWSPDLNPCDLYLLGNFKQFVYAVEITDRSQLFKRIQDAATHNWNNMNETVEELCSSLLVMYSVEWNIYCSLNFVSSLLQWMVLIFVNYGSFLVLK